MKFLELTQTNGTPTLVNVALVAYIYPRPDGTLIQCSGSTGTTGIGVIVRDSYEQVGEALKDLGVQFAGPPSA